MAEDAWLKCEREFFVQEKASDLGITPKNLNKAIEAYNRFLQKALFGESPFVAQDLKLTIMKAGEDSDRKRESGEPRESNTETKTVS